MFHYSVLFLLFLLLNTVEAVQIHIDNAGFEKFQLEDYFWTHRLHYDSPFAVYTDDPIPGWTMSPDCGAGTYNPRVDQFADEAPEGNNVAYSSTDTDGTVAPAFVSQILDTVLEANTQYTLTMHIGNRLDIPSFPSFTWPGYIVQLLADGKVLAEDNNSLKPSYGEFLLSTFTFNTSTINPQIGQLLEVRFGALNNQSTTYGQVSFDDVRLEAVSNCPDDNECSYLYGIDDLKDELLIINTSTGEASVIGALGYDVENSALDCHLDGTLYGILDIPTSNTLTAIVKIDTDTGAIDPNSIVPLNMQLPDRGMAFSTDCRKIYVTATDKKLYIVNQCGTVEVIGDIPFRTSSLERSSIGYFTFSYNEREIKRISTLSGITSSLLSIDQWLLPESMPRALAYSPSTGLLYTVDSISNNLIEIDVHVGDARVVGSLGSTREIGGMVFNLPKVQKDIDLRPVTDPIIGPLPCD
ncbi:hypothetical protein ACFL6U_13845 [Planctomycetota bacterium]